MYNYSINTMECVSDLSNWYNKSLECVLKFIKEDSQKVICKVYIKECEADKIYYIYDCSLVNTSSLTFISFVKSVIPSILDLVIDEQEKIMNIIEVSGEVRCLELNSFKNLENMDSEVLYDTIYSDMKEMCRDLNISEQILSSMDKDVSNQSVEENTQKMLNSDADFDPNFEILKNKLEEVSNRDISAKSEKVVEEIEDEDYMRDVYKVSRVMNEIEKSVSQSKNEFSSGKEYFLLNQMSEYMWKYLKSVNSKFPNPEFLGVCDYYLTTQMSLMQKLVVL